MKKILSALKGIIDKVNLMIVHGGSSHLDEYMSLALVMAVTAIANNGKAMPVRIARRNPTQEELDSEKVLVMDVGGVHDPARLDFDHHQLARGTIESAMGLVASWMGVREAIGKLFPWFETRVALDATGPFATAKMAGTTWDTVAKFLGPWEEIVLRQFEDASEEDRWRVVAPLAEEIAAKVYAYDHVRENLKTREVDGVEVYDFLAGEANLVREVSDSFVGPKGVAVFHDDRGAGLTLLRLNDDPRIDFSRLEGDPAVAFAHKGGFIIKTVDKIPPDEVNRLIRAATVA